MPQSNPYTIGAIIEILDRLNPESVLELGVGMGKYGFIIREQLEVAKGRLAPETWVLKVDGIEACREYHNPVHDWAYNHIWWDDARTLLPRLDAEYDIFLAVDVIEHVTKREGLDILNWALKRARFSVISTPRYFWAQDDMFGNRFEEHHSLWSPLDFPGTCRQTWSIGTQLIVLSSLHSIPPILRGVSLQKHLVVMALKTFVPTSLLGWRSTRGKRAQDPD